MDIVSICARLSLVRAICERGFAGRTRYVRQARSCFLRLDVPENRLQVIVEPCCEPVPRRAHLSHDRIIHHHPRLGLRELLGCAQNGRLDAAIATNGFDPPACRRVGDVAEVPGSEELDIVHGSNRDVRGVNGPATRTFPVVLVGLVVEVLVVGMFLRDASS